MKRKHWLLLFGVFLLLALGACSFNLAGDVTPPPGWQPTAVPPTPDMSAFYPALPPDPAAGEAIYRQACLECHGEHALGDGPQAAELPSPPAALAAPEEAREDIPAERFWTVIHGKPEEGMPPWGQELTTREVWDVLAYIYTLGVPEETLQRGASLYAQRCVACHGKDGAGKGLVSQQRLAQKSDEMLFAAILGPQHPDKVTQGLSDDDRWALVAYLRTLSFAQAQGKAQTTATPTPAAETTPNPTAAASTGGEATPAATATPAHGILTVSGQVTNGTAGAQVPSDLEITLHGYDDMQENYTATAKLDDEGKFVFQNVPNVPNRVFFVTAKYQHVVYGSRTASAAATENALDLPLTIYETTTDHSALQVDRLHVFASLQGANALQVVEIYVITNNGDKTVVGESEDAPALTFELPQGATHVQFQDGALGDRYVEVPGGFGDLMPVYPQYTMQEIFAYDLPFSGKEVLVSHPVPLPVSGVVVMTVEGELAVKSDALTDAGVQTDSQGNTFHVYNGNAIEAGEDLAYTVQPVSSGLSLGDGSKASVAIGLMAMGAALIAVAVVLLKREPAPAEGKGEPAAMRAEDAEVEDDPDVLMDAILALDDLYKEGKIAAEAYKARRAALKARLKALLAEDEQA